MNRNIVRWGALVVLGMLTCWGCGGGDGAGSGEPQGDRSGGAPGPTVGATGEPVTVWVIEDSSKAAGVEFPNLRSGIKARVARINVEGLGGSGRPVRVRYCSTGFDPNTAAKCARDAVADRSAIAVAASISANGDTVLPILEEGGLPNVGATPFSQRDGTSPISFPTTGGLITATGCQAAVLRDVAGAEKIGVARSDTPGADQVRALLGALGVPAAAEVVTPTAEPDYSAQMGAISAKADAVVLAQDPATALKAVTALRSIGSDVPVAGSGAQSWTPERIKQAGEAVEGMYLALWFALDDAPGAKRYVADMRAIDALDQSDDQAKLGWVAFELLHQAARGLPTLDRASITTALSQMRSFDGGGLTPTIDFTTPGKLLFGAQPRLVNDACVYGRIKDGRIVSVRSGFVRPFATG